MQFYPRSESAVKESLRRRFNEITGGLPTATAGWNAGIATAGVVVLTGLSMDVKTELGLDWEQLALLLMVPETALFPGQWLLMRLSRRFDRRRFIAAQHALSTVLILCMLAAFAAGSYAWLLVFTALNAFVLPVEPIARALNTAYVDDATRRMPDAERKRRRDRQEGQFGSVWLTALNVFSRLPIVFGAVAGLGFFAGLMALCAVLALRFLPRVGRLQETTPAKGTVTGLSRSARWRLYTMLCLTGVAVSVAMVGQPIMLEARHEPTWLFWVIAAISVVLSFWLFPTWGHAFHQDPAVRMRYALAAKIVAWLALLAATSLDGPLWDVAFVITGVVIDLTGNLLVNDALAIARASVPEHQLAQANGRLIASRIAGIIPGRGLGPVVAGAGMATAAQETGTQVAIALAGLLLVALAGVGIWRWRRPETEAGGVFAAVTELRARRRTTVRKLFVLSLENGAGLKFGAGPNGERVVEIPVVTGHGTAYRVVPLPRGRRLELYGDSKRPAVRIFATLLRLWWQTVRRSGRVVGRRTRDIDPIAADGGITIRCLVRATYRLTWDGPEVTMSEFFGARVTHGLIVDTEPIWAVVVRFVKRLVERSRKAVAESPRTLLSTLAGACGGVSTVAAIGVALHGWTLTAGALIVAAWCWWLGKAATYRVSGPFLRAVWRRVWLALACLACALIGGGIAVGVIVVADSSAARVDALVALAIAWFIRRSAWQRLREDLRRLDEAREADRRVSGVLEGMHRAAPEVVGRDDGRFAIVATVLEADEPDASDLLLLNTQGFDYEVRTQPPPVDDRSRARTGVREAA